MEPQNNFQPPNQSPQLGSDYLNQISTTSQVKTMNPALLWGMIGGVLLLLVVAVVSLSSQSSAPSSSSLTSVASNLSQLQEVSKDAQDNIQSSELQTINSTLNLVLTNTNRDLADPLKAQSISLKDKKNKTIQSTTASFDELKARLEDARLNAVFDRTYAREMAYTLKTLRSDMLVLYKKSSNKALKERLSSADSNLQPLVGEFSDFNES